MPKEEFGSGNAVWYVRAFNSDGVNASEGSAVLVRLRRKGETGPAQNYLLTCAHVVRQPSAGIDRYAPAYRVIRAWKPGAGYNPTGGKVVRIVSEVVPAKHDNGTDFYNQTIALIPNADWVLLQFEDANTANSAELESAFWSNDELPKDGTACEVHGYPGGDLGFKGETGSHDNTVRPQQPYESPKVHSAAGGLIKLNGTATEKGMSGGGVFESATGRLLGLHRAKEGLTNSLHAVSAVQIRATLEVHLEIEITGQRRWNPDPPPDPWNPSSFFAAVIVVLVALGLMVYGFLQDQLARHQYWMLLTLCPIANGVATGLFVGEGFLRLGRFTGIGGGFIVWGASLGTLAAFLPIADTVSPAKSVVRLYDADSLDQIKLGFTLSLDETADLSSSKKEWDSSGYEVRSPFDADKIVRGKPKVQGETLAAYKPYNSLDNPPRVDYIEGGHLVKLFLDRSDMFHRKIQPAGGREQVELEIGKASGEQILSQIEDAERLRSDSGVSPKEMQLVVNNTSEAAVDILMFHVEHVDNEERVTKEATALGLIRGGECRTMFKGFRLDPGYFAFYVSCNGKKSSFLTCDAIYRKEYIVLTIVEPASVPPKGRLDYFESDSEFGFPAKCSTVGSSKQSGKE